MGQAISNYTRQTMAELTGYVNSVTPNTYPNVKLQCNSIKLASLTTGGSAQCGSDASMYQCKDSSCLLSLTELVPSICSVNGVSLADLQSNIVNNMPSTLQGFFDTASSNTSAWLQTAINVNTVNIKSTQALITKIANVVAQNASLIGSGQMTAANSGNILICGMQAGVINISQNAAAQAIASAIISAILNAFVQDADLSTLATETDMAITQTTGSCTMNSDCPPGMSCVGGVCKTSGQVAPAQCSSKGDCPPGYNCTNRVCTLPPGQAEKTTQPKVGAYGPMVGQMAQYSGQICVPIFSTGDGYGRCGDHHHHHHHHKHHHGHKHH